MNNSDPSLDRLFAAAARHCPAQGIEAQEPPFGFSTRVVAGWLSAASIRSHGGLETLWFRRAFLCALAVMAISVGWSYKADTSASSDEVAIASFDNSADLP